jgi:hypothetical protein
MLRMIIAFCYVCPLVFLGIIRDDRDLEEGERGAKEGPSVPEDRRFLRHLLIYIAIAIAGVAAVYVALSSLGVPPQPKP